MKYQLVLQFPGEKIDDFDQLLKLELDLSLLLETEHVVDGHDFTSGKMNIFIHTNNPEVACKQSKALLAQFAQRNYMIACSEFEGDGFTVLYPNEFEGEFCVK